MANWWEEKDEFGYTYADKNRPGYMGPVPKEEKVQISEEEVKDVGYTEDFFTSGRGVYQKEADEILKQNEGLTDDQIMQKAYDEIKGGSGFTDDYKYDADILAEEYAKQHGKVFADLPQDQISIYYEPALKRVSQDLLKRREARKALKDVHQKVELQMFDTKGRKPNASGGIAGELHLNEGGRVSFVKGGKVSSGLAKVLGV